jgi:hypothetical protein
VIKSNVPFFANPGFFPSPPKSYDLPPHIIGICNQYVANSPKVFSRAKSIDPRGLVFIDDCAIECDEETSESDEETSLSGGSSSSLHYT